MMSYPPLRRSPKLSKSLLQNPSKEAVKETMPSQNKKKVLSMIRNGPRQNIRERKNDWV